MSTPATLSRPTRGRVCRQPQAGFAPLIHPTLPAGVNALVTAVREALPAA
ncbi:MAG: hypothetical protein ABSA02_42355 [Trebonia sp.]